MRNFDRTYQHFLNEMEGGRGDKMSVEDIANKHGVSVQDIEKQLEMGLKIEMEHTDDPEISRQISMDHLAEFPDYYTGLEKMEIELSGEDLRESIIPPKEYYQTIINPSESDKVVIGPSPDFKHITVSIINKTPTADAITYRNTALLTMNQAEQLKNALNTIGSQQIMIKTENAHLINIVKIGSTINMIISKVSADPSMVGDSMLSVSLSKEDIEKLNSGIDKLI